MHKILQIEKSKNTPEVTLNAQKQIFRLDGEIILAIEGVQSFQEPILDWLGQYSKEPNNQTTFTFSLNYSSKGGEQVIVNILNFLYQYVPNIEIVWEYTDEDGQDHGVSLSEYLEIPFTYKSKSA